MGSTRQRLIWAVFITAALFAHSAECTRRAGSAGKSGDAELATGNDLASNTIYEEGDISSDESLIKGKDAGWDPSFLDMLSSDYFDETPSEKKKAQNKFADEDEEPALHSEDDINEDGMGVPVAPGVGVEEEEIVTSRAPCSGCPRDVDPEDSKIQDIASFALQKHLESLEETDLGRHLVRVVKAQTQLVAGQKYLLDLELGYSNCSKAELVNKDPEATCLINPEKDTFICNFEVLEQKWRNHTELLLTKCDQIVTENDDNNDEQQQRDPEEAEGRIGELDSDEVDAPTTTITSATNEEPKRRKKRDADADNAQVSNGNIGGLRDADEDKETLLELARYAVEQLDVIDEDNDARLVMDILSAKKQTVSGWLYHLRIRVAQTTCEEGTEVTYEKCKDKITLPYKVCVIKVLFQPWQTVQKKVTESQCYEEKMKKGKKLGKQYHFKKDDNRQHREIHDKVLLGGYTSVNPDSQDLADLTEFVMSSLDAQSNAMHAQKVVRVIEAQRQVVSGVKTKMLMEIGYTTCRKHKELERSKCDIDESREHNFCRVTVWEQPWKNTKKVTDSKCGKQEDLSKDNEKREKRSPYPEHKSLSPPRSSSVMVSSRNVDLEEKKFGAFMAQYEKSYETDEEYQYRLGVFKQNMQKIKLLQQYEEGTAQYGVTRFADLTEEEYSKHYLGLRPDLRRKHKSVKQAEIPNIPTLPEEFDWRHYNAVTPVKNQGMCGSCWAFSVTGNIEGLYSLKHKNLMSFSEQELVDCDTLDEGCNGGLPENAYKILEKIGGLETEGEYPYDGRNEKCSFDVSKAKAKVKGFVELPKNETEMAMWLTKNGPISIGINANAMQFYWGGVSKPWKFLCSPKSLDHGVLIVGYGVHTTSIRHKVMPYWLIKNSWGPHWGEQGYYRVYRGANTCGVSEMATSATIF